MRSLTRFLALLLCAPAALTSTASAQGIDGLDDPVDEAEDSKRNKKRPEVKEVTKGFYAKANAGGNVYLLDFNGFVSAGTAVGLSLGQDFVDNENYSVAWEGSFYQGINNGCGFERQAVGECAGNARGKASPYVQGDLRTYSALLALEGSVYPSRRFGIGARLGGGVMGAPLLMDEAAYERDVVQNEWNGVNPGYHSGAHPLVLFGPTFEYYTKLGHFSVGADIDAFYAIGFDLGMNMTGYMKYTF